MNPYPVERHQHNPRPHAATREAVARALAKNCGADPEHWDMWADDAEVALLAAAPHISNGIRAWGEAEMGEWATPHGVLKALDASADAITSRICGSKT
jgi:hypothetical protein